MKLYIKGKKGKREFGYITIIVLTVEKTIYIYHFWYNTRRNHLY